MQTMKYCTRCKRTKSIKDFEYKPGRFYNSCNSCTKVRQAYEKTEKYKAYRKVLEQTPKRKMYQSLYSIKHRKTKKGRATLLKYKQSEAYRLSISTSAKKRAKKFPEKRKAISAIGYIIKIGILPHPTLLGCFYCALKAKNYHHPNGYDDNNKFDVIPVCIPCHVKRHSKYHLNNLMEKKSAIQLLHDIGH